MSLFLLGLTGSIGTGKSTTAKMLGRLKLPIFDADHVVHQLLEKDESVIQAIADIFPDCIKQGHVCRATLGSRVAHSKEDLRALEDIIHPRVQGACRTFISECRNNGTPLAVLEIPLLYEKGYDLLCDKVIVTVCQPELQRQRVMARPGMTQDKFDMICANQINSPQKAARADFVLVTDDGELATFRGLRHILTQIRSFDESPHAQHCS